MYGINNILLDFKRSDYSGELSEFEYKIDCSLGTNPYGKWPGLKIDQEVFDNIDLYPHGRDDLIDEICKYFNQVAKLGPRNIGLGCGSIGTIMSINRMFLKTGKKIIGIAPQFTAVIDDFHTYEADYDPIFLSEEDNYQFILDEFLDKVMSVNEAYIYIDNPNNPTGQIILKSDLEIIISEAKKRNSFVLIDEAYGDYMDLEESSVDLLDKYDNLAVVRSFSKGLGLAGIRLGYVIASEVFISAFDKVNVLFADNSIALNLAEQVINSGWNRENRSKINEGKKRILSGLSTLKVAYTSENIPISMIYCDNKDIDLCKLMEKTGLKVVSCEGYDGVGKNVIRLNLHSEIDILMDCLKETERLLELE